VFLLHVRSGIDEEKNPDFAAALTDAERLHRRAEAERIFAKANEILALHGLTPAREVAAQGKAKEIISRYANRLEAGLVVTTAGLSLSCATLIARCGTPNFSVRKLLLPVDDSDHSLEAARRITEFIRTEGVDIHLLHVATQRESMDPTSDVERVFTTINAALACQGLISHRQVSAEGKAVDQILRYAGEMGADLIVMGSRGRSTWGRILMGSVSHSVSTRAKCPVMIVRTPDEEVRKAA
jgi:nucleotide-binding universal stress UspA family protein